MKSIEIDAKVRYFTVNTYDVKVMMNTVDREVKLLNDTAKAFYAHKDMPEEQEEFRNIYIDVAEALMLLKSMGFHSSIRYKIDPNIYTLNELYSEA